MIQTFAFYIRVQETALKATSGGWFIHDEYVAKSGHRGATLGLLKWPASLSRDVADADSP